MRSGLVGRLLAACLSLALLQPVFAGLSTARADDVGAAIGATAGLFVAGPVGLVLGAIVGEVFGNPWWFADPGTRCYIDTHFVRHCPKMPMGFK